MTTTITIETHDCPVLAITTETHHYSDDKTKSWRSGETQAFIAPHTKAMFHISSTNSIEFRELPKDATGLPGCDSDF